MPLTTKYATIVKRINYHLTEICLPDRLLWPEIRISFLLFAGYTVHERCRVGWNFDRSRAALFQKQKFQYEGDMTEYAPLVLFHGITSSDELNSALFVSIPVYKRSILKCEIGVFNTCKAQFMILDYDLYSSELACERRADVPLRNGQAVVVKYREGARACFLTIEALNMKRSVNPRFCETKTDWLHSKLFPVTEVVGRKFSKRGLVKSKIVR